jgi:hypothetical protein
MSQIKMCGKCKQDKSEDAFAKNASRADGLDQWCKECRKEYVKQWIDKKPEKRVAKNEAASAYSKKRYAEDPEYRDKKRKASKDWMANLTDERRKAHYRKGWLWSMYRLRPGAFDEAVKDQNGCCACCGDIPQEWIIDHCHDTGLVRGLVCRRCNNGLGSFDDDIKGLEKAIAYLRAFNDRDKEP